MRIIRLEAGSRSSLDWTSTFEQEELTAGPVVWFLDLGLFDRVEQGLSDEMQFQTLGLAIEHFAKVLPDSLKERTAGVALYQGSELIEEQIDYLALLRTRLPVEFSAFLLGEVLPGSDPCATLFAWSEERLEGWDVAIHGAPELSWKYRWDGERLTTHDTEAPLAVLLPPLENPEFGTLPYAVGQLIEQNIRFRAIPLCRLSMEWHGLEQVIVAPECLTVQGRRQLQGFQAAAGTVLSLGEGIEGAMPFTLSAVVSV